MKIGFRILNGAVVVFGVDNSGNPFPPDTGTKGYLALLAIAQQRAGVKTQEAEPCVGKILDLLDIAQNGPDDFLPKGFYIIEVSGSGTDAGLHLYDGNGTHVLGPVQDSADIVMARARHSR